MNIANKTVLVTGSEGFIGSHLIEALSQKNVKIKAFVQYNSYNNWGWLETIPTQILNNIEVISGDVRDSRCVSKAIKGSDIVLHLAALIAIPYSYNAPEAYVDTNVTGTLNILNACLDHNVQKVIHTSTSEVYGTAQYVPIDEKHPLNAQSPYAATKIAADQLALSFHKSFGLPVGVLRPFNTYGPRQSARAIIPTIISQISSGKTEIEIGSTTPTRDFTFVKDSAQGFILAAESDSIIGNTYNIGSNFEISVGELVSLLANLSGKKINIKIDTNRIRPANSEVERLFASTELATKHMSWNPQYGGIEGFKKGLLETMNWFQDKNNLSKYKTNIYNV